MSLNSRKIAFLGLLLAFCVILVVLGSVVETSTLFFLAAASFCVGIAFREFGSRLGGGFYAGSVILGLLISPNKLYCATFAAMGFYIAATEILWERLDGIKQVVNRKQLLWGLKYLVFNLMFVPAVLLLPQLFYQGDISAAVTIAILAAGQIVLFIYDQAYRYFQHSVWGKWRHRIIK